MNTEQSSCCAGFLHEWDIVATHPRGTVERCRKCLRALYTPHGTPSFLYLLTHIRSALQPSHPRFTKEYPNAL